jgi:hypothetical protein
VSNDTTDRYRSEGSTIIDTLTGKRMELICTCAWMKGRPGHKPHPTASSEPAHLSGLARVLVQEWNEQATVDAECNELADLRARLATVEAERDEARARIADALAVEADAQAAVDAMREERDEARREVCQMSAIHGWSMGCATPLERREHGAARDRWGTAVADRLFPEEEKP